MAQALDSVSKAREDNQIENNKAMTIIDPAERASAHDILNQHFPRVGMWIDVEMTADDGQSLLD